MKRLLALVLVVLAACGGDDGFADYIDQVSRATRSMQQDALETLPPGSSPTRVQVIDIVDGRRATARSLRDIEPPDEFSVEHAALITALTDLAIAGDEFISSTQGLDPDAFQDALRESTEIDVFAETVAAVCAAWEARAADLGHEVDLGC